MRPPSIGPVSAGRRCYATRVRIYVTEPDDLVTIAGGYRGCGRGATMRDSGNAAVATSGGRLELQHSNPDPTGVLRLMHWVSGLRQIDSDNLVSTTSRPHRLRHPGLLPAEGPGLILAQAVGNLPAPGESPQSLAVLSIPHLPEGEEPYEQYGAAAMFGALLTLVADRRYEVLPEVSAKVGATGETLFIPLAEQPDSTLSAPPPLWTEIDPSLRDVLHRLTSLDADVAGALCAAIHMHYCAALLQPRDPDAAYAVVVGGLEALAQEFGEPPSEWNRWSEAPRWDKVFSENQFTASQSEALRQALLRDEKIQLAETFASYVAYRLPDGFWSEEVRSYVWGIDTSGIQTEGFWTEPRPRGPESFVSDREAVKRALKKAYTQRSQFVHAGKRGFTFVGDLVRDQAQAAILAPASKVRPSLGQIRACLRELILFELNQRGDPDPRGLAFAYTGFAEATAAPSSPPHVGTPTQSVRARSERNRNRKRKRKVRRKR